ncbi:MAG: PAS domain S-box protein [Microscillaceae bacterium]|nr:PAS domain S-box protein [Microscillaceae bacterium]
MNEELSATSEELRTSLEELQAARLELEIQKDRLELIIEAANLGTWDWDMATDYTEYNERWATMLGYRLDEIPFQAQGFTDLLHPEDAARFALIFEQEKKGELLAFQEEIRLRTKSGEWKWILDTGKVFFDAHTQRPYRALGIHQDIDARKNAEALILRQNQELRLAKEELKTSNEKLLASLSELTAAQNLLQIQKEALEISEEKYRIVVETQADFVLLSEPNTRITFANQPLARALGTTTEAIYGLLWKDFAKPEDIVGIEQNIAQLSPENNLFIWENRDRRANGEWGWTQWLNQGIFNEEGKLTQLQSIGRDITALRAVQEALLQSEKEARLLARQYQSILDSQAVYVIKTDIEGRYTYINDYFRQCFGYQSFLIGQPSLETIVESDRQACIDTVILCIEKPELPHEVILCKLTETGEIKAGKWEFKGVLDEQGQVSEILCVGFDITAQVEALAHTQRLLDISSEQNTRLKSFTYIVSHNIRSHAANISGLLQLMLDSQEENEKQTYLEMLRSSANQLEETIFNLNEILSINENLSKPRHKKNLRAEVFKTLEILSGAILQHEAQIEVQVPEELSLAVISAYLDSILLNLLSNALKYRHPQRPPHIIVNAYQEGPYTVLQVQDNGLGIDLERHRDKLFGMYKTFHGNEDARGFGLFITKTQVEALGGRIEVESETGNGSLFKVYFYEEN